MQAMRQELDELKLEMGELRGELAQEKARTNSLKNILRANGLEIPRETVTAVVFTPYPDAATHPEGQGPL
jgi:hypothetical protein